MIPGLAAHDQVANYVEGGLKVRKRFSDHRLMSFGFSGVMDTKGVGELVLSMSSMLKGAAVTREQVQVGVRITGTTKMPSPNCPIQATILIDNS